MLLRRHPVFLLWDIILFAILAAIPVGVVAILQTVSPTILTGPISMPIVAVLGSIYYLAIWLFFFSMVIDYYLDIWVITNDRLIAVEQRGLFSRTVSEMDLWMVQDVTSEVNGISATIFGYGKLSVQSAAEQARFHFENLHDPNRIRQRILDLADEDRKYHVGSVEMKKVGM
jgi:membrane protein YdbS with pleckstrin-like domain